MLPLHIYRSIGDSLFARTFGDKSSELARKLLTNALEKERDSEAKAEIERRLELLEPKSLRQIRCGSCGKMFHPRFVRRYSKNLCMECLRKRYTARK